MDILLCNGCHGVFDAEDLYKETVGYVVSTNRSRVLVRLPEDTRASITTGQFCLGCVQERQVKLIRSKEIRDRKTATALKELVNSLISKKRTTTRRRSRVA